jgi:hypothetical protein
MEKKGMDIITVRAFRDELEKIAALTPEEKKLHAQAVRQHAEFDRMSGAGKMDDAAKERMRHNVERLRHFKEKKHNDSHKIPGWAKDMKGKPPAGYNRPRGMPDFGVDELARKVNKGMAIGAGAILGGVAAHNLYKKHKAKQESMKKAAGVLVGTTA